MADTADILRQYYGSDPDLLKPTRVLEDAYRDNPFALGTRQKPDASLSIYEPTPMDYIRYGAGDLARTVGHPDPGSFAGRTEGLAGLLPPVMAYQGGHHAAQGYAQGDVGKGALGALELGLAGLPVVSGVRQMARKIGETRAEAQAADAAKGPWGNPEMLDDLLNRPQTPRHELNAPRDAGLLAGPQRRSSEQLNNEYQALIDEGRAFVRPQMKDNRGEEISYNPLTGQYSGYESIPVKDGHRWNHSPTPDEAYQQAFNARRSYHSENIGPTPAQALAADIRRHGANNEHVPGFYDKADALAQRLEMIEARQRPMYEANLRDHDNLSAVTGFYDKGGKDPFHPEYEGQGHRYLEDARKFGQQRVDMGKDAESFHSLENDELQRILTHDFGADLRDKPSIEQAYNAFWADENARRAAGQMTRHEESARQLKWSNADFARRHWGLDPDKPEDAARIPEVRKQFFDALRGDVAQARDRALGTGPSANIASDIGKLLARYAPPTAVGAYAGHKLFEPGVGPLSQEQYPGPRTERGQRGYINRHTPDLKYPPWPDVLSQYRDTVD